jgi:transcriptional regulator with XRE-family HTH domain
MGPLESFRKSRGLTQQQLAEAVGLRSKGYISAIESGREACSLRLALKLERLSDGELKAGDLCEAATGPLPTISAPGP